MLPILNISSFIKNPDTRDSMKFVEALRQACHETGFFYLIGHGVDGDLESELMTHAKQFFALPEVQRHRIAIGNSPHFRGYTILGDERTRGKRDWRDQLDIGPEEPAIEMSSNDPIWRRLRGPNQSLLKKSFTRAGI